MHLTANYGTNPAYNCARAIIESLQKLPGLEDQKIANLPAIQNIKGFLGEVIIIGG